MNHQRIRGISQEKAGDSFLELGRGKKGGVDDKIRALPHRAQHLSLQLNGLLQTAHITVRQRMLAPRLLKAVAQNKIGGIQKKDLIIHPLISELLQRVEQCVEHIAAANIRYHGNPAKGLLRTAAKLMEGRYKLWRDIIYTIESNILHCTDRPGFSRAGHPRHYHKFHTYFLRSPTAFTSHSK